MAENHAGDEGRIRTYLAGHGGSVEDAAGRGLTDDMARAIGMARPAALSVLLAEMESEGVITREMRGLRTYRIALVDSTDAPVPVPAVAPAAHTEPADAPPGRVGAAGRRYGFAAAALTSIAAPPASPASPALPAEATEELPRALSLREAINGAKGQDPGRKPDTTWAEPDGAATAPTSRFSSLRSAPPPPPPPSPSPAWTPVDAAPSSPPPTTPRSPLRLPGLVPQVTKGPSTPLVTAVVLSLAGLVLVAVITVIATAGSNHHVAPTGAVSYSADACRVVPTADASVALGDDAGAAHYVLGACVYDDGHQELIVEVARQAARQSFDGSHSATAKDIPGLGDGAYYDGGTLRVLKGTSLMLLTINPFAPDAPSAKLLALAQTAVARL